MRVTKHSGYRPRYFEETTFDEVVELQEDFLRTIEEVVWKKLCRGVVAHIDGDTNWNITVACFHAILIDRPKAKSSKFVALWLKQDGIELNANQMNLLIQKEAKRRFYELLDSDESEQSYHQRIKNLFLA